MSGVASSAVDRAVRTTVVVVTWRGRGHLAGCLDGLAAQSRAHQVLVVDNASDDGTAGLLARHPCTPEVLRLPRNAGYAGALAAALGSVRTPYLAWLNDDAVPEPGWLAACEDTLDADQGAAAVASTLLHADGTVQSAGVALTADAHGADISKAESGSCTATPAESGSCTATPGESHFQPQTPEVFGFCGGAAVLRTDVLRDVGGVPAAFFCYYEDTDTSWRLRLAGWRIVSSPSARVWHGHGTSTRLGSVAFHRWNERNRLLTLLRCAPAGVAAAQLIRFAAITALLPVRKLRGKWVPSAGNFTVRLRARVLAEVAARLPETLLARARITGDRCAVWRSWSDCGARRQR